MDGMCFLHTVQLKMREEKGVRRGGLEPREAILFDTFATKDLIFLLYDKNNFGATAQKQAAMQ